jgi:hypothetical protein
MGSITLEVDIERGMVMTACNIIPLADVGCSIEVAAEIRNKELWFFIAVREKYVTTFEAELRVSGTQADKHTRFQSSTYKHLRIPTTNIQAGLGLGCMYFDEVTLRKLQAKHARPSVFFILDIRNVKSDISPASILLALAQDLPSQRIIQERGMTQRRLGDLEKQLEDCRAQGAAFRAQLEDNTMQLALRTSELESLRHSQPLGALDPTAEPAPKRACVRGLPSKTDIIEVLPTLDVEALIDLSSHVQKRLHEKLLESRASLTCPVCLEKPKTFKYRGCSHSVCAECATQALVAIKCGECRAENPTQGFDPLNL